MIEVSQALVEDVGKTLHVVHGRGYCSQGQHLTSANYACWDEARAVLAAINGHTPRAYPDAGPLPATLAAREAARAEQAERARQKERAKKQ